MKRAEVLDKIKAILNNLQEGCSNNLKAQAILLEIESLGMMPPRVETKVSTWSKHGFMHEIAYTYKWED